MPSRDPFVVLGLPADATPSAIKAAWRRLAREHHPDLASDPVAARRATRRMAEINAAYEELRDPDRREARRRTSTAGNGANGAYPRGNGSAGNGAASAQGNSQPDAPPRPHPRAERPVTGRLDTSELFQAFDAGRRGGRGGLPGHEPRYRENERFEPPRASEPTGPAHRRRGRPQRIPIPDLATARAHELAFGKFRGHTLGQVADFEPSYVDWIARTISRDPELVAAARVLHDDLDRRGVVRRDRPGAESRRKEPWAGPMD